MFAMILGILLSTGITSASILLLGILVLPIHYTFSINRYDTLHIEFKVWWAEGLAKLYYRKNTNDGKAVFVEVLKKTIYKEELIVEPDSDVEDEQLSKIKTSKDKKERRFPKLKIPWRKETKHFTKMNSTMENVLDTTEVAVKRSVYELEEQMVVKDSFSIKDIPWSKELFHVIQNFFVEFYSIIKPKILKGKLRFGFEEPSSTGLLCAVLSVLYPFLPTQSIDLEPDFSQTVLEGYCDGSGQFRMSNLVHLMIRTYQQKPIRELIKTYNKKRKGA